jgi:hypothetical protein
MEPDIDRFVVCPTCRFIEVIEDDEGDRHRRPCPECGWTLMLVEFVIEDGECEFSAVWDDGDGAPLYLPDLAKAITIVNEFLKETTEQDERREERLTAMRLERQQQEEEN